MQKNLKFTCTPLGGGSGGGVMVGTEPEQKENNTLPVNNK
jgi:hypothetical protein